MAGSIIGPRAKVWRAAKHQVALEDAMAKWLDRKPYGIFGSENPDTGWFETRVRELEPPPLQLGTIFGDFVSNLESALDLLVYQLVIASDKTPSTGNYFPVVTNERRWESARRDKLKGVGTGLADRLKPTQPFGEDPRATNHPLVVLHTANKINKHHVISPIVVSEFTITPQYELNRSPMPGERVIDDPGVVPPPIGSKLQDDQLVGRLKAVSPRGDLRITRMVSVESGSMGVAFDLPIKIVGEAPNLIEYVVGVIDKFEDVLGIDGETGPRLERYPPGRHDDP